MDATVLAFTALVTASLGLFAAVALALAGVGVYGVMTHATERGSREIGIRMALGAGRERILRIRRTSTRGGPHDRA